MPKDVLYGKTLRKSFARVDEIRDMPNLLEIQKSSYKWFLETGLHEVFRDVDSVTDYSGNLELSFIDYSMNEKPKYSEEECKARDATYAAPLKVRVRLRNKETEEIKEQEIFMGDFPIMTPGGTFVINGAERVIVSQIVRSPGVYFDKTTDKAMISVYASTVIPYHGAWLEYETDANDVFNVRIDKNRKLPITWFLKAMGAYDENKPATWLSCVNDAFVGATTNERLKEIFGEDERMVSTLDKDTTRSREECLLEIYRKLRPGDPPTVESSEALLDGLFYDRRRYEISNVGRYKFNKKLSLYPRIAGFELAEAVADPFTGEVLAEAGEILSRDRARAIADAGVIGVTLRIEGKNVRVFSNGMVDIRRYIDFDPAEVGVKELVRGIVMKQLCEQYEGEALKDAIRENIDVLIPKHIVADDIFSSVNYLNALANGVGEPDDIDHLGNRRVRCVGELLQNQFRIGFSRMERVIRQPHGARDPRAHDPAGSRHRDPAEPYQHPSRHRGDQGVLRLLPAEPVHGPDQPPGRADPQAPYVGPRPRRSESRARELRCARRSLHPLRPPLPDRDARRSEHRSDQLPGLLCPRQRVRLPGRPLPQGGEGDLPRHRRGGVHDRRYGGPVYRRAGLRACG